MSYTSPPPPVMRGPPKTKCEKYMEAHPKTHMFLWLCIVFTPATLLFGVGFLHAQTTSPQLTPAQVQECERCERSKARCQEIREYCAEPCGFEYSVCDRLCHQASNDTATCVRDCSEAMIECTSYCDTAKRICIQDSLCQPYCRNQ